MKSGAGKPSVGDGALLLSRVKPCQVNPATTHTYKYTNVYIQIEIHKYRYASKYIDTNTLFLL